MQLRDIAITDYSQLEVGDSVFCITHCDGKWVDGSAVIVREVSDEYATVIGAWDDVVSTYDTAPAADGSVGVFPNVSGSERRVFLVRFGDDLDDYLDYYTRMLMARRLRKKLAEEAATGDVSTLREIVADLADATAVVTAYEAK